MQQAPIPLLSDQDCFDLYQQANLDTTEDMQCAGGQEKGACNVNGCNLSKICYFKRNKFPKEFTFLIISIRGILIIETFLPLTYLLTISPLEDLFIYLFFNLNRGIAEDLSTAMSMVDGITWALSALVKQTATRR